MSIETDLDEIAAYLKKHADEQMVTGVEPTWCEPLRRIGEALRAIDKRLLAIETAPTMTEQRVREIMTAALEAFASETAAEPRATKKAPK
jgi:hypothetical protein